MRIKDWISYVCSSDLFGRAQEDALRIGQREIANDHLAIKRAVEPADADLHPVLELIFFDLGDDEAPSGVAVQADTKQREEQEEPEQPEPDPAQNRQRPRDRKSTRLNSTHYCAYRLPHSPCNKTHTNHA